MCSLVIVGEKGERRKTWGDGTGKRGRRKEGKRDILCPFSLS
jgi:hypothetical protein